MKPFRICLLMVVSLLLLSGCTAGSSSVSNLPPDQPAASSPPSGQEQDRPLPTATDGPSQAVLPPTGTVEQAQESPEATSEATGSPAQAADEASPTPRPMLKPDEWKTLPVVPEVSDRVLEIHQRGLALGVNPNAFSKIGDCGSTPAWFLGDFDRGPRYYDLGEHTELEDVIAAYAGSFDRTSLAARSGFNASALFVALWADRSYCAADESPLACEYRIHRPAIALIMLGTNDVWRQDEFEPQMRKIIEFSLDSGVIPVLSTKADNQEGDGSINATIARLTHEYEIPLWNYWAAVQELPDGGLQEDGAHLTWGANRFDDPQALQKAWPVRNLTALQVLDAVWEKLSD